MNLTKTLPMAVLGLLALAACSSGDVEGTAVIGDVPFTGDGPLAATHRECTDGAELLSKYNVVEADMIPAGTGTCWATSPPIEGRPMSRSSAPSPTRPPPSPRTP